MLGKSFRTIFFEQKYLVVFLRLCRLVRCHCAEQVSNLNRVNKAAVESLGLFWTVAHSRIPEASAPYRKQIGGELPTKYWAVRLTASGRLGPSCRTRNGSVWWHRGSTERCGCRHTGAADTVVEMDKAGWQRILDVDLKGVWLGMRALIPGMLAMGGLPNRQCASMAGLIGLANLAAYSAGKGGVIALTRQAAIQYAASNVLIFSSTPSREESSRRPSCATSRRT